MEPEEIAEALGWLGREGVLGLGELRDHRVLGKLTAAGDEDPFAPLSFPALSVIPRLRLTERGLLDLERWELLR